MQILCTLQSSVWIVEGYYTIILNGTQTFFTWLFPRWLKTDYRFQSFPKRRSSILKHLKRLTSLYCTWVNWRWENSYFKLIHFGELFLFRKIRFRWLKVWMDRKVCEHSLSVLLFFFYLNNRITWGTWNALHTIFILHNGVEKCTSMQFGTQLL